MRIVAQFTIFFSFEALISKTSVDICLLGHHIKDFKSSFKLFFLIQMHYLINVLKMKHFEIRINLNNSI